MSRFTSFAVSILLLFCCFLPSHPAFAALNFGPGTCTAVDASTLQACVAQLRAYDGVTNTTYEVVLQNLIACADTDCNIVLDSTSFPNAPVLQGTGGVKQPPQIIITGNPDELQSASGLIRTGKSNSPGGVNSFNYKFALIDIQGLSNVTISDFTIDDEPASTDPIQVYGTVYQTNSDGTFVRDASGNLVVAYTDLYCGAPDPQSAVGSESLIGHHINAGDSNFDGQTELCPSPGYVTVQAPNATGGYDYPDVNTVCFFETIPSHICPSDQIHIRGGSDVAISGMVLNHAQGGAVGVGGGTQGFYFIGNTVQNAFLRGLTISSGTIDVSIEGNTFFANRAAAMNVILTSSTEKRPSDVSNNTFDHNQHGDAFPCFGHEGCSGGQLGITGVGFVFYGNKFINGYMDFYDPQVFEEPYGYDAFSGYDLSTQVPYASTPAGQLWANGGGVNSGWTGGQGAEGSPHQNVEVEITNPSQLTLPSGTVVTNPTPTDVVFSNNFLDYGFYGLGYDPTGAATNLQVYNNEVFQNSGSNNGGEVLDFPSGYYDSNNCESAAGCGSASDLTPVIIGSGPSTASAEDSDCHAQNGLNCLWVTMTEAWAPANSLALGSAGGQIRCALKIYGPGGGTLLATVQGSSANCSMQEAVFTIPGSVAQHQTSVQIAYENLSTGQVSAKKLVPLAGMVPTITGAGLGCSGDQCIWITATDTAYHNCAVGIYNVNSGALITTLSGSQVNCTSTEVTFYIPASILSTYTAVNVNYQNLNQGTWSGLWTVTLPATGGGGGGGSGGCSGSGCP